MLKRMNENAASIPIVDDDEDPSASIDALVGKSYFKQMISQNH
jgi:hypothetical protein